MNKKDKQKYINKMNKKDKQKYFNNMIEDMVEIIQGEYKIKTLGKFYVKSYPKYRLNEFNTGEVRHHIRLTFVGTKSFRKLKTPHLKHLKCLEIFKFFEIGNDNQDMLNHKREFDNKDLIILDKMKVGNFLDCDEPITLHIFSSSFNNYDQVHFELDIKDYELSKVNKHPTN